MFTGSESTVEQFELIIQNLITKLQEPKPLIFSMTNHDNFLGPIIFLDFDGVCCPFSDCKLSDKFEKFNADPNFINLLKKYEDFLKKHYDFNINDKELLKIACWTSASMAQILSLCRTFNAKIVVSSNWRRNRSVVHLQNLLDLWGLGGFVIGKTKDGNALACDTRAAQIKEWIADNKYTSNQFLILDDGYIPELTKEFPNHFVHCDTKKGFDEQAYINAENVLKMFAKASEVQTSELKQPDSNNFVSLNLEKLTLSA
jgi:hypothetical protein